MPLAFFLIISCYFLRDGERDSPHISLFSSFLRKNFFPDYKSENAAFDDLEIELHIDFTANGISAEFSTLSALSTAHLTASD